MNSTLVVLGKELRIMARDRRLIGGVLFTSLVAFPLLIGFTSNIDRLTGAAEEPVPVLLVGVDEPLREVLAGLPNLDLRDDPASLEGADSFLQVERRERQVRVLVDGSRRRMLTAARAVTDALEAERQSGIESELARHHLSLAGLAPYAVELVDRAGAASRGKRATSLLVPYMVVLLLVSNAVRAVYVAVGEKEKNTLASLLVSIAPRRAIVLGKSLAIVLFSLFASALLVTGLGLASHFGLDLAGGGAALSLSARQVVEIVAVIMPLALSVGALVMLLGTWARSQREAGIYTAPLVFLALFLALFSMSGATPATATFAAPILGNAMALRESLLGSLDRGELLLSMLGNLVLCALLLGASVRLYRREEVLFRQLGVPLPSGAAGGMLGA